MTSLCRLATLALALWLAGCAGVPSQGGGAPSADTAAAPLPTGGGAEPVAASRATTPR